MLKIVNDCVDCVIPCVGGFCRMQWNEQAICDRCGDRAEVFFIEDDEVLCRECFIKSALDNAITITAEQLAVNGLQQ